jgi:hypothetical protein
MTNILMSNRTLNLLPADRIRLFVRDYFFRLGVVFFVAVIVVTGIAAAVLLPTYEFLNSSLATGQAYLATLTGTPNSPDLSLRRTALAERAALIAPLAATPSVSTSVRDVLTVSRSGISLFNINYTSAAAGKPGTMLISGTASTRDALHTYQLELQKASFVKSAEVPVSAYAKDAEIPFTITITLAT